MKELIKEILSISDKSFYNWKHEKRPIISFLQKYFKEDDLKEFLETGEILDLELFLEYKKSKSNKDFELFKEFKEFNEFKNSRSN